MRAVAVLGSLGALFFAFCGKPIGAAELDVPHAVARAHTAPYCGPCGCLRVAYVRHPVLGTTYGTGFDPRNYDQTEPHYYLGRLHRFPRYFVDGVPAGAPGSC
jgi:hypothetical protein